jgi:hypothetical protein
MEAKLNKLLYKLELYLVKIIPIVITVLEVLNTVLSYLNIDVEIISMVAGMSLLPLLFLYVSSYVFRFCSYHRMFIHYIAVNEAISWYDYKIGIPITDKNLLVLHLTIVVLFFILIIYLKFYAKCTDKTCSKIS